MWWDWKFLWELFSFYVKISFPSVGFFRNIFTLTPVMFSTDLHYSIYNFTKEACNCPIKRDSKKFLEVTEGIVRLQQNNLGADHKHIFNPGWNFNLAYRVEISSRLNSKLLFKMALQLHVKISTRHTELKFQLGSRVENFKISI